MRKLWSRLRSWGGLEWTVLVMIVVVVVGICYVAVYVENQLVQ